MEALGVSVKTKSTLQHPERWQDDNEEQKENEDGSIWSQMSAPIQVIALGKIDGDVNKQQLNECLLEEGVTKSPDILNV
jgi:hypothetical protein